MRMWALRWKVVFKSVDNFVQRKFTMRFGILLEPLAKIASIGMTKWLTIWLPE
jgi:hypothetical protein